MQEVVQQLASLAADAPHHSPVDPLTEQEHHILKLFAAGRNSATIARTLNISAQTLRNHLHHINQKLRTHYRLEAVTHAQRRGLLD
jgi:DNA-binding NarL/FixJ family response regulator